VKRQRERRTGVSASDTGQTGSWYVKIQRERRTGVSASDIGQTGSGGGRDKGKKTKKHVRKKQDTVVE